MRKYFDVVFYTTSIPVANALVYVTDSNGNLAQLYSDNGVTPITNPTRTDSTGFYSFYVADGIYTLKYVIGPITLRTLTGVQIFDESTAAGIPNEIAFGTATSAGTLTGAETAPVSRGAGLLQTTWNTVATFVLSIFTIMVGAATGLIARTILAELLDLPVSVKRFGAKGDGTIDDTAAIKAACAALNAAGGGTLYFPPGQYLYTSTTFTDVLSGVTLRGANRYASVIVTNNVAANMFFMSGSGSKAISLGFVSTVTSTGGTFLIVAGTENVLEDLYFSGDFNALNVVGAITKINNLRFGTGAAGGNRIIFNCGDSSPVMSNVLFGAQSAPFPNCAIQLENVTALKLANIDALSQGIGLLINPGNGQSVNDVNGVNCFFDGSTTGMYIEPTGSGNVSRIEFVNSWTGDSSANGVFISNAGTGVVKGIDLINHQSSVCGQCGISTNGACSQITVIGGLYAQNGIDGAFFGHSGDVTVIGAKFGSYAGMTGNTQNGILLSGALTSVICEGNGVLGNGTGGILDQSSASLPKFISANVEPGFAKFGSIMVGASPFLYTAPFDQAVYIAGGAVTGVVVGGVTPFGSSNVSVILKRGDSVQVTYTATPFMSFTA